MTVALRPTKADTVLLRCRKCPVATVGRSVAAGGHNPKMIGSASAQPGDVGTGILIGVPAKALIGCGRTITGSSAVLEVNACAQAMGINCSIECGRRACYEGCRIGDNDRRSCSGKRGKRPIHTTSGTAAVGGHDPEMKRGTRF